MGYTLLQMVQAAEAELGLSQSSAAISSTELQPQQFAALANRLGDTLMRRLSWTALEKEYVLSIVAPTVTTGNTLSGSRVVTNIPSTAGLSSYYSMTGSGIQQAARIATVDSGTQITMNEPANATATGVTLTFSQDTYALPADFQNFVDRTQWDRSRRWELRGPMSPQEYQWIVSGIVATGPRRRFRQKDSTFIMWPPPSSQDTPAILSFEYLSDYWAADSGGTAKRRFTADTDTCVWPDELMVMGLKWMFFQAKGFEYTLLRKEFESVLEIASGQDGGAPTLDMSRRKYPIFISPANVPDAGFGNP